VNTAKVKLSLDEYTMLIELSFLAAGETDEEHNAMAKEVEDYYQDMLSRFPEGRFKVLVDLSNAGLPTKDASNIYTKTLSDKRIEKAAIFGMGLAIKSVINFIVAAAGRDEHTRFFVDREQALAWLLQDQAKV
jgi:hypothetical protein